MPSPKTCPQCTTEFETRRPEQVYCSKRCHGLSMRTLPDLTCETCGEKFRPGTRGMASKFCSTDCRDAGLRARVQKVYDANPRLCPCGKPIPYEMRHKWAYHSEDCPKKAERQSGNKGVSPRERRGLDLRPEGELREQVVRMYTVKGYGKAQISEATQVPITKVKEWLEGLERGPRMWRGAEEPEAEAAIRFRRQGCSAAEIAGLLRRSETTIRTWLLGVEPEERRRTKGEIEREEIEQRKRENLERDTAQAARVVELYRQGASMGECSDEIGRSLYWVKARLLEAGVELRVHPRGKRERVAV